MRWLVVGPGVRASGPLFVWVSCGQNNGMLFVDLIRTGVSRTNQALEILCKAHGDDDESIWSEHWSPLVRRLIELFTKRGLDRLEGVRRDLSAWMAGDKYAPGIGRLHRPPDVMGRWTEHEVKLVTLYLQSLPSDEWTLDDHMLMVDLTVQRHLPADDMRSEAKWLAQRAVLMGRVQDAMGEIDAQQADKILAALPGEVRGVDGLMPGQIQAMEFAANRAAEHVVELADDARHKMRGIVARHVEARQLGTESGRSLEGELLDAFGTLNRDWRRIAVTEAGEAQLQGYIAGLQPGTKVKRFEQYKGACAFCASINGRVMEVVDPAAPDKDWDTQIWPGKNNVGRSAAPRKRVGDKLVEREPHERWSIPAGLVHPHCRGAWLPVIQDQPGDDTDFGDYLRAVLGSKS